MVVIIRVSGRDQRPGIDNDQRRPNSARRISSDRAARSPLPECGIQKNSGGAAGSAWSASWPFQQGQCLGRLVIAEVIDETVQPFPGRHVLSIRTLSCRA
jgi:hypothetical protein